MSENSDDSIKTRPCEVCQQPAERRCSACRLVFYCSAEHQKENWNDHKSVCKPYEISQSKELGRFLIATRNLEPSDVIFNDSPIVFGPKPHRIEEGPFPCVGCCRLLYDQTCERCLGCSWPVCSVECQGLKAPNIHGFECNVLRLRPPSEAKPFHEYYRFDVLIILRALFLQKTNVKKWEAMLNLEDHLKERGPNTKVYKSVQEKVNLLEENYLKPLKRYQEESGQSILPEVPSATIHRIYGILDVNSTELTEDIDAAILYPTASLLEHNCMPNTIQTINDNDNFKVTFRAALPIQKGEHISSIYTHILWGTSARRHHLKKTKYFSCTCQRCQDPTEMGTFISALRCLGTENEPCGGTQLPVNPIANHCEWACNKCDIKLPNKDIMKFVNHLSGEVDKIMEKHPKLGELEDILSKLLNFLHPNHYLVYSVKHSLVQLIGSDNGLEISNDLLNEKLIMCEELIDVTRKIDPGNARLSLYLAVLLNEQFITKFKLLIRSFEIENKDRFSGVIKDISHIIEESKRVLQDEKTNCEAGFKLFKAFCQNEAKFNNWRKENGMRSD